MFALEGQARVIIIFVQLHCTKDLLNYLEESFGGLALFSQ
jgi:hypothetical protein